MAENDGADEAPCEARRWFQLHLSTAIITMLVGGPVIHFYIVPVIRFSITNDNSNPNDKTILAILAIAGTIAMLLIVAFASECVIRKFEGFRGDKNETRNSH